MSTTWVATVTVKTDHPREVAAFWRDFLDYRVAPNHSDSILLTGTGPSLLIQPAASPQSPGPIHLDLRPDDQSASVARALSLGAVYADVGQSSDEGWVVMSDPGGNLFCILESNADHARRLCVDSGTPTAID